MSAGKSRGEEVKVEGVKKDSGEQKNDESV
jgi:hypothetical protein